jgi:hypothetical protein
MQIFELPHAQVVATIGESSATPTVRQLWFGPNGRELAALVSVQPASRLENGRFEYDREDLSGRDPLWEWVTGTY